jgi:hypothetical protein
MVVFNVIAEKSPSATLIEELVALLVAAGLGTFGTTIFGSSQASIPAGDGPYITIVETGGPAPRSTHNVVNAYEQTTAQITTRAATYAAARSRARTAYGVLAAVVNRDVSS